MARYERPYRRATRSRQHDYDRPGRYFVTICAYDRDPIFGEIVEGVMTLSHAGQVVETCWYRLPHRFRAVELDEFVVMPNHVHGIITLTENGPGPSPALHDVVGAFKTDAARRINALRGAPGVPVWQRSFHDQVVRDAQHVANVRAYILTNPANWPFDEDNPTQLK